MIARIAPLLGLEPRFDLPPADKLILASAGGASAGPHCTECESERDRCASS